MKTIEQIMSEARLRTMLEEANRNDEVALSNQDELNAFLADYHIVADIVVSGVRLIFATSFNGAVLLSCSEDKISLDKKGSKGDVSVAFAKMKNELINQAKDY